MADTRITPSDPPRIMCRVCKETEKLFRVNANNTEMIPGIPDVSGKRVLVTQMEVEVLSLTSDGYVCLSCGYAWREIKQYKIDKSMANVQVQQQQAQGQRR